MSKHLVLHATLGIALASAVFSQTIYVGPDQIPIQETTFGYHGIYKVLRLGLDQPQLSLALNVDPYLITGGQFSGVGQILIGNNGIMAPNQSQTDWIGVIRAYNDRVFVGGPTSSGDLYGAGITVMSNSGNVGIGTTSPDSSLTIVTNGTHLKLGTASSPDNYYATISSRYDSSHPFAINVANNNTTASEFIGVYADGGGANNRIVFPSGNFGIGTTTPNDRVEIAAGSSGRVSITDGEGANRKSLILEHPGYQGNSYSRIQAYNYQDNTFPPLTLQTAGGNVGIALGDPQVRLDVAGSIRSSGAQAVGSYQYGVSSDGTFSGTVQSNVLYAGGRAATGVAISEWTGLRIDNPGLESGASIGTAYGLYLGNVSNGAANYSIYSIGGTNYFAGRIGIGTAIPEAKLHVSGGSVLLDNGQYVTGKDIIGTARNILGFGSSNVVEINRDGNHATAINPYGGNVGIGTINPSAKLSVLGNAYINGNLNVTGSFNIANITSGNFTSYNQGGSTRVIAQTGGSSFWSGFSTTNEPDFSGAYADYLTFGSAFPQSYFSRPAANWTALLSAGNASNGMMVGTYTSKPIIFGTSNTERLVISEVGNVGIGVSVPTSKLSVTQNIDDAWTSILASGQDTGKSYGLTITAGTNSDDIAFRVQGRDGANYMSVRGDGNVGIATASPDKTLDVMGQARATYLWAGNSSANTDGRIYVTDSGGSTKIYFDAYPGQASYFNNGNVGIGTSNPMAKLQVNGDTAFLARNSSGNALAYIANNGVSNGTFYLYANDGIVSQIGTRPEEPTFFNGGNVGIGTAVPLAIDGGASTKFHVDNGVGTGSVEVGRFEGGADADNTYGVVRINHANDRGLILKGGRQIGDTSIGFINLTSSPGPELSGGITLLQSGTGVNIGIGTESPSSRLSVVGNANIQGNLYVAGSFTAASFSGGSTGGLAFNASGSDQNITLSPSGTGYTLINGNVGIGTATPSNKLDVQGESTGKLAAFSIANTSTAPTDAKEIAMVWKGAGSDGILRDAVSISAQPSSETYMNGSMLFLTSSGGVLTEKMRITGAGNVGIGVPSPSNKFEVNGTIRAREVLIESINWPDYVFSEYYRSRSLEDVERFIDKHKHLPEIPSAQEVSDKGVNVGQMQALLLKKIEELTLHVIEQEKRIKKLEEEKAALQVTNN